jgi:hypothetical protein
MWWEKQSDLVGRQVFVAICEGSQREQSLDETRNSSGKTTFGRQGLIFWYKNAFSQRMGQGAFETVSNSIICGIWALALRLGRLIYSGLMTYPCTL